MGMGIDGLHGLAAHRDRGAPGTLGMRGLQHAAAAEGDAGSGAEEIPA